MLKSAEDEIAGEAKWLVENVKFSVKQPIEAVVTKEELEHLAELCRSEVDSMGRIAAGVLRLLKLEESIGQATIDQLSNLGSGGLDKVLTPEKLSRRSSVGSISYTPSSNVINESPKQSVESTVASLEAEVVDTQAKCKALVSELSSPEAPKIIEQVNQLSQKLETMQILLTRLRTQV